MGVYAGFMERLMETEEGRAHLATSFRIPLRLRYLLDPKPETIERYLREATAPVANHPQLPDLIALVELPN